MRARVSCHARCPGGRRSRKAYETRCDHNRERTRPSSASPPDFRKRVDPEQPDHPSTQGINDNHAIIQLETTLGDSQQTVSIAPTGRSYARTAVNSPYEFRCMMS